MSDIPWKTFTTERDGVELEVTWWDQDFNVKYKVGNTVLRLRSHIMATMYPMKYNEELIKDDFEKKGMYSSFKEAGEFILNQQVFFDATKAQFSFIKDSQKKRTDLLTQQLQELKQKYKNGKLSQKQYQNQRTTLTNEIGDINIEYLKICYDIVDNISVINQDTRNILLTFLKDLWQKPSLILFSWKIYVPDNDKFYEKEQQLFEKTLRNGHYDFEKIPSQTDNNKCIYFLPNIIQQDLEGLGGHFNYVYSYRAYRKDLSDIQKQQELDDFLQSNNLEREYPIFLSNLSANFFERFRHKNSYQMMDEIEVYIKYAPVHTAKERWYYRGRLYHHPQAWEKEDGLLNKYYEQWKKE